MVDCRSLALSTLLSGINVGYLVNSSGEEREGCGLSGRVSTKLTENVQVEVSGWCEGFKSEEDAEENGSAKKTGPERFEIKRKFEMSEMCGMLLAPDVASMPSLRYFVSSSAIPRRVCLVVGTEIPHGAARLMNTGRFSCTGVFWSLHSSHMFSEAAGSTLRSLRPHYRC